MASGVMPLYFTEDQRSGPPVGPHPSHGPVVEKSDIQGEGLSHKETAGRDLHQAAQAVQPDRL